MIATTAGSAATTHKILLALLVIDNYIRSYSRRPLDSPAFEPSDLN